jgi:prepilin-type N-terminal cleavage/methylation domain-containing protein
MKAYLEKNLVQRKNSSSGFTLMELMVTAAILVVGVTGLLGAIINASILSQASHSKVVAVNDAQYVLEKLVDGTYADLSSHTEDNFTGLNLNNESVFVSVSESSGIKTATVYVNWNEREKTRSFNLTTQIAQ